MVDFDTDLPVVGVGDAEAAVDRADALDAPVRGEVIVGILSAASVIPIDNHSRPSTA